MTTTFADDSSDGTGLSQNGDRSEPGRPDAQAIEELRTEQASLLARLAAVEMAARPSELPAPSTELPRAPEVRDPRHELEALMALAQGNPSGGPISQTAPGPASAHPWPSPSAPAFVQRSVPFGMTGVSGPELGRVVSTS